MTIQGATTSACYAHPVSPAVGDCGRCGRPICTTCAFELAVPGSGTLLPTIPGFFCADCMLAGPAPEQRRGALLFGLLSVTCFVIAFVAMGFMMFAAPAGLIERSSSEFLLGAIAIATFGLTLTGVTTGLIGRERGKHSGGTLALIGLIANGLFLALLIVFAVIGSRGKG
ncbi:MAG TPA: hypothetical protein VMH40_00430 [Myxococcaceae bacterium]|nr:hypothetical protein [Myxococcaceae bacterium]